MEVLRSGGDARQGERSQSLTVLGCEERREFDGQESASQRHLQVALGRKGRTRTGVIRQHGHAASFDARTGRMLAKGKNGFPRKQAGWIETWIEIHKDELSAAWEMLRLGMTPPEIAPLAR